MVKSKPLGSGKCPICQERGQFQVKDIGHGDTALYVYHSLIRNNHYTGYRHNCYLGMWCRLKDLLSREKVDWCIRGGRRTHWSPRYECYISPEDVAKQRRQSPLPTEVIKENEHN